MMNFNWLTKIGTIAITVASVVQVAHARRGEVSGGADSYTVAPAYFRSSDPNQKITLCYELSPKFGVPAGEIEADLRSAFSEWAAYIEAKDLHYAVWTGSAGIVGKLGEVRSSCKGNEDLRVYFGVEHPDVTKFRPRFLNPYAFSAITESSADGLWNKGLLWVAGPGVVDSNKGIPTWNKNSTIPYGALKYVLIHEIGHIFGNGHVDWTVMTSRIGQWLEDWTNPTGWSSGPTHSDLKIDQGLELVPNVNLAQSFQLAKQYGCVPVNGVDTCPDQNALAKAFERIFGHAPVGQVSAVANRRENRGRKMHGRPDRADIGVGLVELVFTDNQGIRKATVTTTAKAAQKDESMPLFNGQHGNHYRSFGASFSGYIGGSAGQKISVLVNFNMGNPLTIVDLEQGGLKHPLLVSE